MLDLYRLNPTALSALSRQITVVHELSAADYAARGQESRIFGRIAMATSAPSHDELARIAERYGFRLYARDVEEFRTIISGALGSYDAVERMYYEPPPGR